MTAPATGAGAGRPAARWDRRPVPLPERDLGVRNDVDLEVPPRTWTPGPASSVDSPSVAVTLEGAARSLAPGPPSGGFSPAGSA
jgi:hypothetical protein